jgi:tRNA nucleotidyltransferase (CCA-adding enzyme)
MSTDPPPSDAVALRRAFYGGLPAPLAGLIRGIADRAQREATPAYLVGGAVRDLLLGRPALDLDLVFVGDAIAVARRVAAAQGVPFTRHEAFGTATVPLTGALAPPPGASPTLDFVTARRETYAAPARLPRVEPAGIADDLARRDFTINAMALPLDPAAPALIDPHGGRADLAAGRIRALHAGSFRDDPTRIFRAVRYATRFAFTIEPDTAAWIAAALEAGAVAWLSPARVRHELLRTLAEPDAAGALARLNAIGALAAVDGALHWDGALAPALDCAATPEERLSLLLWQTPAPARARVAARLGVNARPADELALLAGHAAELPALDPVAASALLRPLAPATLALYRCVGPPAAVAVTGRFLEAWRQVKPLLTGDDLRALGIPPGPRYRELLAALRDARLAGAVVGREDEVALVQRLVAAREG